MRHSGRNIREVGAFHVPKTPIEIKLDFAAGNVNERMAAAMQVARHDGPGAARETHEFVDAAGLDRPRHARDG
jgi:hypothetical protein